MARSNYAENARKLRRAGFKIKSPLPAAYRHVIGGLTEREVDTLIRVKKRLDEAEAERPRGVRPYKDYVMPPF